MGQKVSPVGLRVGVIRNWDAKWYADKKNVPALLKEDIDIRKFLKTTFKNAAVSQIEIERLKGKTKDRVKVTLHTGKPGVVIGRDAENKNKAVKTLEYMTKKEIILNVVEVKRVETNAELVAQSIAEQLENRASFRRVQKIAMQRALKAGAKGVKTLVSGRLGGAEIARSEGYSEGRVPLHTLRADIDYATAEATTTYGKLGVKVWIYKGEVLPGQKVRSEAQPRREKRSKGGK
ncbi:MAG: 30S ribosomal protein S3 [Acholeplasma sp.]|jgi:small subunit ribosomal protein S3|nr:30S ribosomal protein S3 [Acholeplasma sp.]